ncbi:MAG: hypothetical protein ABID54_05225, partial [Pseudomonadota bacterium]
MLFSKRTSFLLLLSGLILVTGFIPGLHSTDAKDMGDDQSPAFVKKEVVGSGIVYLSGGVGFEERNALEKMGRKYPLKLV